MTVITGILGPLSRIVSSLMTIVLSIGLLFGLVTGPATDEPLTFQDSESCNLSFVLLADTHVNTTAFSGYYFECAFRDIANSGEDFDALVIAGDIAEFGDGPSYETAWKIIDESTMGDKAILLASGNHDIRLAYESQTKLIMDKTSEYLTNYSGEQVSIDKPYYSYDVNGYTFIVLGSDEWEFEKARISDEQLAFIDSELARATADGKPAFVVVHQPLDNTHGLPEVWENGGLGADSEALKAVLLKHRNVFLLNGHLHDGIYEKSLEVFDEDAGVYSINLPSYGKDNDYGAHSQVGLGDFVEVYEDRVVITARDFQAGKMLADSEGNNMTYTFYLK